MGSGAGPTRLSRVVGWFRAGHPRGLIQHDYIALFAVLHRDLTEAEVDDVARSLLSTAGDAHAAVTRDQIRKAIAAQIHERPRDRDVRAVAARISRLTQPTRAGGQAPPLRTSSKPDDSAVPGQGEPREAAPGGPSASRVAGESPGGEDR